MRCIRVTTRLAPEVSGNVRFQAGVEVAPPRRFGLSGVGLFCVGCCFAKRISRQGSSLYLEGAGSASRGLLADWFNETIWVDKTIADSGHAPVSSPLDGYRVLLVTRTGHRSIDPVPTPRPRAESPTHHDRDQKGLRGMTAHDADGLIQHGLDRVAIIDCRRRDRTGNVCRRRVVRAVSGVVGRRGGGRRRLHRGVPLRAGGFDG